MSERSLRSINTKVRRPDLVAHHQREIVRAATKVFKEKGFHLATVRDLGEAAGLTQGTLYNYVRSKGDILFLVCDHLIRDYQAAVSAAIAAEKEPKRRLTAALRALVATMDANQDDLLLLYQELHALERDALHAILHRSAEFIDDFVRLLEANRKEGVIDFDPQLGAEIITFLPVIVALQRWRLSHHADPARVIDGVVDFMKRGLGVADHSGRETGD